jgi:hypothetical protein
MDETLRDLMQEARDYARTYSGRGSAIMQRLVQSLEGHAEVIKRQNSALEDARRRVAVIERELEALRGANASLQIGVAENARARRDLELLRRIVLGQQVGDPAGG